MEAFVYQDDGTRYIYNELFGEAPVTQFTTGISESTGLIKYMRYMTESLYIM